MGRSSVDKLAVSREPHGRQPIWDEIVKQDGWFGVADIRRATFMDRRTIASYLACLCAANMAERENIGDRQVRYRLIGERPIGAPRLRPDGSKVEDGSGTENMWRTIRMMPRFTAREIAIHATTSRIKVSEQTAQAYCGMLFRTGYLRVMKKAVPKRSQAVFKLVRNNGPKPPMIQRVKQVFDPNSGEIFTQETRQ